MKKNINDSLKLFQEYIFLIKLYSNNKDLKSKYKILAKNATKFNWIKYFEFEEQYLTKKIEKKVFIRRIKIIKDDTKDLNLIYLINKHINT